MKDRKHPMPRLTAITLGVGDVHKSSAFYESLGFERKLRVTGDGVAFFDTGGVVLALYPWDLLAHDAASPQQPRPTAFRGSTLAWNCQNHAEVDDVLAFALSRGATLLKPAQMTEYGGYSGYFSDPDGHPWEVVVAPGMEVGEDRRIHLPD